MVNQIIPKVLINDDLTGSFGQPSRCNNSCPLKVELLSIQLFLAHPAHKFMVLQKTLKSLKIKDDKR